MRTLLNGLGLLFLLIVLTSSGDNTDYRKTATEQREVNSEFTSIEVSRGLDLVVSQNERYEMTVTAHESLMRDIVTEISDGVLRISLKDQVKTGKGPMVVSVSLPVITGLKASSGSDIRSKGNLRCEDIRIRCSSGSDADLELEASRIDLEISSGSDAGLKGRTGVLDVRASSGSDLSAKELQAGTCKIRLSSASDAEIWVTGELDYDVSSGADLTYRGNPQLTGTRMSSGASVNGTDCD